MQGTIIIGTRIPIRDAAFMLYGRICTSTAYCTRTCETFYMCVHVPVPVGAPTLWYTGKNVCALHVLQCMQAPTHTRYWVPDARARPYRTVLV